MSRAELAANWETAAQDLGLRHPDPDVTLSLVVEERPLDVKILFVLGNLKDSTAPVRMTTFEYYFYANHWPGIDKARAWIHSAWALLMEHEGLELAGADPHHSEACAAHRADLDRRHNMDYMLSRKPHE